MTRILPEERRHFPRLEIGGTATMVFEGRGATGTLADISVIGAALRTDASPKQGDQVVLHMAGLGRLTATVRRVEPGRVALSFVTESREQWNLVKKLAKLLD